MVTIFDQTENYKENALERLRDEGSRLFDLGYKEAKLRAEEEQKARGDAVRGDHFDLAVPTHSEALELGVRYATVYWCEEETK